MGVGRVAKGGRRPGSGRKARPPQEKIREGTYRPDRDGPEETLRPPDLTRPRMPVGMSSSAKTAWKTLLDDLEASALLDSTDAPLYEAFAINLARAREARRAVKTHGLLVTGSGGQLAANPAVRLEREAMREVRMLADQLAIGMSARARLGMAVARGARAKTPETGEPPRADGIGPSPRLTALAGGKR